MNIRLFFITSILFYSLIGMSQTSFIDVAEPRGIISNIPSDTHGSGVAAADFDNDGDIDLYVCTARGERDLVYENLGAGSFKEVGESLGLMSTQRSRMAIWIDYDGDHLLDILVGGDCDFDDQDCDEINNLRLFKQENGAFVEVTEAAGLSGYGPSKSDQAFGGMAAGDINNDGFVDFVQTTRNGQINLFLNNSNSSFTQISELAGLSIDDFKSYQSAIIDIDNDGYADIYFNIDFSPNQLWLNNANGTFTEVGEDVNANNSFNEMGLAIADFDNDEDFDIYSTNIANYLGQDVHNILLKNELELGGLNFSEVSKSTKVHQGGWGWGVTFLDINNNGWQDLATTNGWDLPFEVIDQSKLWLNNNGTSFSDVSTSVGFDDELNGASLIALDYDRDGDLDLIQTLKGKTPPAIPLRLLDNQLLDQGNENYLTVKPRMIGNNHFSIGAIVKVRVGDAIQSRIINSGSSFYGQEPAEAFFGLGANTSVDELTVIWPGGLVSSWQNLAINQVLTVTDEEIVQAPSFLKANQIDNTVVLSWNDYATNETGYVVQKSLTSDYAEILEFPMMANTSSYIDSDVKANAIYFYRVYATNGQISSGFSNSIEVVSIITGLSNEVNFNIYPNPIAQNENLIIEGIDYIENIALYDLFGRKVLLNSRIILETNKVLISMLNIKNGLYILSINGVQKKIRIQ